LVNDQGISFRPARYFDPSPILSNQHGAGLKAVTKPESEEGDDDAEGAWICDRWVRVIRWAVESQARVAVNPAHVHLFGAERRRQLTLSFAGHLDPASWDGVRPLVGDDELCGHPIHSSDYGGAFTAKASALFEEGARLLEDGRGDNQAHFPALRTM
jgi:hypothetical protein